MAFLVFQISKIVFLFFLFFKPLTFNNTNLHVIGSSISERYNEATVNKDKFSERKGKTKKEKKN